ncbi:KGK domain-containing protein [Okeanomitos corallinicola TIOX110]|uniref:KGK domain-containing protein n=1 Tax=Okeanomitos corallinicola TIOX110 TaxID=3133117 RepID=A0ABZ2UQN5_9CYAN
MNKKFDRLDSDDVISVNPGNFERLEVSKTFTVVEIIEILQKYAGCVNKTDTQFFTAGMEAKVLRPGDSWKTGKIRIGIEFCPAETKTQEIEVSNNSHSNLETAPLNH